MIRTAAIHVSNFIAAILFAVAERVEDWARHMKRCHDCGRSRYYGAPCVPQPITYQEQK